MLIFWFFFWYSTMNVGTNNEWRFGWFKNRFKYCFNWRQKLSNSFVTINDAIWVAYSKKIKTRFFFERIEYQTANIEKEIKIIKNKTSINVRIYFKNTMFVLNFGQLKFRFIQDFTMTQLQNTQTKQNIRNPEQLLLLAWDNKWRLTFVKDCSGCKINKTSKNKYHGVFKPLPIPNRKWVHISIGFMIDFPVNSDFWGEDFINIMVIINRMNQIVKCIFMDRITIENSARGFYIHVLKNHGLFNFIISNWIRPLVNHFCEQSTTRLRISTDFPTIYHPKTDNQTKIMNSVFEQYFIIYVNCLQNDWAFWVTINRIYYK